MAALAAGAALLAFAAVRDGRRALALEEARATLERIDRAEYADAGDVTPALGDAKVALDVALATGAPSPEALYLSALARTLDQPSRAASDPVASTEAEALLRRALARNPYDARAHVLLGRVLAQRGPEAAAEAEREVRAAERVSPQHREILELVGDYAIYRAVETGDGRFVDWAVDTFRSLHRLEPDAVKRTVPLLRLFLDRTEDLARAIPDELHPRLQFASSLMGMDRSEDAMAEYRRADSLDPASGSKRLHEGEGCAQEGRLLVWRGEWAKGGERLLAARAILGSAFVDSTELARAMLRSGRVEDARAPFVEAVRRTDRSDRGIDLLLEDIRAARAFESAQAWIAEALAGTAQAARRSFLRGRVYLMEGSRAAAKEEFLRSLHVEKDPQAYAFLARLSIDGGDFDSAAAYAERALLYDPSNAAYSSLLEESRRRAMSGDTSRKEG
ncbi:MAG: hypothetical protein HYR85_21475 [Planctomycetes bacterium]|nr:hypothetical protein [Planctomycetota bacterium]MBI3845856.1 hypothetical protein [Planctomycetota bacterium]